MPYTKNHVEPTQAERDAHAARMTEARLKLHEAEKAWFAAFAGAPLGDEREFAGTVYERIRCATRRPY